MTRGFRRNVCVSLLVLACGVPRVARGEDDAASCSSAHLRAQKDRRDHHLLAARADLLVCARDQCPSLIRVDCSEWLGLVESETPSIVVDARHADGTPLTSAHVVVDAAAVPEALDGKAMEIDPGAHLLRVDAPGSEAVEQRIVVLEGVRAQHFLVTLADTPDAPVKDSRRSSATLPLVLGAVGVVGIGFFTGFGVAGLSTKSDLDAQACAPRCDPQTVDRMRRDFAVADVSLLVGLGALTVAGILFGLRGTSAPRLH